MADVAEKPKLPPLAQSLHEPGTATDETGNDEAVVSTELSEAQRFCPSYKSIRIDRNQEKQDSAALTLPHVPATALAVPPNIGAIAAAAFFLRDGKKRRKPQMKPQTAQKWTGAGLATGRLDRIRRTPGHGKGNLESDVNDARMSDVDTCASRRHTSVEWGSNVSSRVRKKEKETMTLSHRAAATDGFFERSARVPPAHNPYETGWLGGGPGGRWIVDEHGRPRCIIPQAYQLQPGADSDNRYHMEEVFMEGAPQDWASEGEILSSFLSGGHQQIGRAESKEKREESKLSIFSKQTSDEYPSSATQDEVTQVCDLAQSCYGERVKQIHDNLINQGKDNEIVPPFGRAPPKQPRRRTKRFVSFGVLENSFVRAEASAFGESEGKSKEAVEDVEAILLYMDGKSRRSSDESQRSFRRASVEIVAAQVMKKAAIRRNSSSRLPTVKPNHSEGLQAALNSKRRDVWRPKSLKHAWQWEKFKKKLDIMQEKMEQPPSTPSSASQKMATSLAAINANVKLRGRQEGAGASSSGSGCEHSQIESEDDSSSGLGSVLRAVQVPPTCATSKASSSKPQENKRTALFSLAKIRAEAKRMKDGLLVSAQKAFTDDVFEECGIESDHLKKNQLMAMITSGFADALKMSKKQEDDEDAEHILRDRYHSSADIGSSTSKPATAMSKSATATRVGSASKSAIAEGETSGTRSDLVSRDQDCRNASGDNESLPIKEARATVRSAAEMTASPSHRQQESSARSLRETEMVLQGASLSPLARQKKLASPKSANSP